MLKRSITGLFIVGGVVGFFFLRGVDYRLFNILLLTFSAVGTYEMINAFKAHLTLASKIIVMIFAIAVVPLTTFFGITGLAVLSGGFVFVLLTLLVFDYKRTTLDTVGYTLFSYVYPNMLVAVMVLMNALEGRFGMTAMLLAFVICPFTDTFAYLVGSLLHGPKMCPSISPNKTISGGIGGLLGGIIASICLYYILGAFSALPEITFMSGILLFILVGFVTSAFTQIGDLAESAIKRKAEIKDMGKIFPGHGGMLDRIDGLTFASVFIFAVFKIITVCA